jgi:hypothetical protein
LSWLALGSACVLVATLALPSSMPGHQYDYYVYFGLPVASLLTAMPLVAAGEAVRTRLTGRAAWALVPVAIVVAAGALLQGKALHDSNRLVAAAAHTQLVDRMAAEIADGATMYFLPPVAAVHEATLGGASVAILRPDKRLTVAFAGRDGAPAVFSPGSGVTVVQTRRLAGPHWQGLFLSQANWGGTVTRLQLDDAHELVQPFSVVRGHIAALAFPADWYGSGCAGEFALEGPPAGPTPAILATGRFACGPDVEDGVARLPMEPVNVQAGAVHRLRVRITAGSLYVPLVAASSSVVLPAQHRHGTVVESLPGAVGLHVVERAVTN